MCKYYEKSTQGYCPKCGREILDWCDSTIDGDEVIYYFVCDCGLAGSEYYKLVYQATVGDDAV